MKIKFSRNKMLKITLFKKMHIAKVLMEDISS